MNNTGMLTIPLPVPLDTNLEPHFFTCVGSDELRAARIAYGFHQFRNLGNAERHRRLARVPVIRDTNSNLKDCGGGFRTEELLLELANDWKRRSDYSAIKSDTKYTELVNADMNSVVSAAFKHLHSHPRLCIQLLEDLVPKGPSERGNGISLKATADAWKAWKASYLKSAS